jgi:hypothetical protein
MRVRLAVLAMFLIGTSLQGGPASAALPVETFGCNDPVDHSVRLGGDVGSFASPCPLHGLRIVTKGITVDLGGYTIFGNDTNDSAEAESGLYIEDRSGVQVRNGLVRGFERGVLSANIVGGTRVEAITASNNIVGIVVTEPKGTVITRNIAVYNFDDGIRVGADNAVISGNVSVGNFEEGISTTKDRNVISGNHIARNSGTGIDSNGVQATISNNQLASNGAGIDVAGASSRILSNTVTGTTIADTSGIAVNASKVKVIGNRSVDNLGSGIETTGDEIVIARNLVASNQGDAGIKATGDLVRIGGPEAADGNTVMENLVGISVDGGDVRVVRNRSQGNGFAGIFFGDSDVVEITGNRIVGNGFEGINVFTTSGLYVTSGTDVMGGSNFSAANRGEDCLPSSICHGVAVPDLPETASFCGNTVVESIRLAGDIGSPGAPCPGDGIEVIADNIVIDLNGHTIYGSNTIHTSGVDVTGHPGVSVLNGDISGFDNSVRGFIAPGLRIAGVVGVGPLDAAFRVTGSPGAAYVASSAFASGSTGARIGDRSVVSEFTARESGDAGVDLTSGLSRLSYVVASDSGSHGVFTFGERAVLDHVVSSSNGAAGVAANTPVAVRRSVVADNHTIGGAIVTFGKNTEVASTIASGNNVGIDMHGEGSSASANFVGANTSDGITSVRSTLTNNTVIGNGDAGIDVEATPHVITGNRAVGNFTAGIATSDNGHRMSGNITPGNGTYGIFVAGADPGTVRIRDNVTYGNGHRLSNQVGLGISAPGQIGGGNRADANDDPSECEPASLC